MNRGDERLGWFDVVRGEVVCDREPEVLARVLAEHGCDLSADEGDHPEHGRAATS